jgi:CDP-paratose 2-epimerase|tara:strand:+ start:2843 stop:3877 length:1035 start_codon:yes stop_codon:yes gene_type:complete
MKILITGGCGFVGSNLAIYLKKKLKNSKIFSLDNLFRKGSKINRARLKDSKITNYRINIQDYKKISKLPKFDLIIDCCAEPAIEISNSEPDRIIETNLTGTFNILKKCKIDKSKIIFLSTSRVYSIDSLRKLVKQKNITNKINIKFKINEEFQTKLPKSLYGFSKLSSEDLIKEYNYSDKIKYIINRFGVIAGPWQFGKQDQGFISMWVAKHLFKKKLSYIGFGGNGNQIRDVIHVDDVCKIIFIQIINFNKKFNNTFNIGGGLKNAISLKELTSKCEKLSGNKLKIRKLKKTSMFDIPYFVTDNKKINKFYNWNPSISIDQILKDVQKWLIENKKIKNYFNQI